MLEGSFPDDTPTRRAEQRYANSPRTFEAPRLLKALAWLLFGGLGSALIVVSVVWSAEPAFLVGCGVMLIPLSIGAFRLTFAANGISLRTLTKSRFVRWDEIEGFRGEIVSRPEFGATYIVVYGHGGRRLLRLRNTLGIRSELGMIFPESDPGGSLF